MARGPRHDPCGPRLEEAGCGRKPHRTFELPPIGEVPAGQSGAHADGLEPIRHAAPDIANRDCDGDCRPLRSHDRSRPRGPVGCVPLAAPTTGRRGPRKVVRTTSAERGAGLVAAR